jgi:quinolinate synthase
MAMKIECAESQETRVLPLLNPQTRAKHDVSKRVDGIPLSYAQMDGDELDRRISAAKGALYG